MFKVREGKNLESGHMEFSWRPEQDVMSVQALRTKNKQVLYASVYAKQDPR